MAWQQSPSRAILNSIAQISWLPNPQPTQKKLLPPSLVVSPVTPPAWVVIDGGTAAGLPPQPIVSTVTQDILILAWLQLQDILGSTFGLRWGYTKLLEYLNLAILEILNLKPEALASTVAVPLNPGPLQHLPTGAIALIDAGYNLLAPDGVTYGDAITAIEKETIDEILPGWTSFPAKLIVSYVVFDKRNPKVFYTFPPQPPSPPGPGSISMILTMTPAMLTNPGDTFPLDSSYKPAVVDYIVSRGLSEETTIPGALQKGQSYFNKFLQDLGLKSNVEKAMQDQGQ